MNIFKSETELVNTLNIYDSLVLQCASGKISFWDFTEKYNDFYSYYALDGHESDEEENLLFEKYKDRIKPHEVIAYEILGKVCSDEDAKKQIYINAGRFGSEVAIQKLKEVVKKYSINSYIIVSQNIK